jgi:phosphoenolpyruvate synthase/pyruvate phosphate dikinase
VDRSKHFSTISTLPIVYLYQLKRFDEDNTAVKTAITQAIKGAHRNNKEVGFCGQAPSDKPDFASFLVDLGIDSISLTPDSVLQAIDIVSKAEMKDVLQKEIDDVISLEKAKKVGKEGIKQVGV